MKQPKILPSLWKTRTKYLNLDSDKCTGSAISFNLTSEVWWNTNLTVNPKKNLWLELNMFHFLSFLFQIAIAFDGARYNAKKHWQLAETTVWKSTSLILTTSNIKSQVYKFNFDKFSLSGDVIHNFDGYICWMSHLHDFIDLLHKKYPWADNSKICWHPKPRENHKLSLGII